jgi:hypothetical protein
MAVPPQELVRRAFERARRLTPGVAPDSAELVELARGQTYVVVRRHTGALAVFDGSGRLVKAPQRLREIAAHVRSTGLVETAYEDAKLEQRLEHAERSLTLLRKSGKRAEPLRTRLAELVEALEAALEQQPTRRALPPTRRTLPKAVSALNDAAAADRAVVLEARRLAAGGWASDEQLRKWTVARLASVDLPGCIAELDRVETERFVAAFVSAARAVGVTESH